MTTVCVTHDLFEAMTMGDRVAVLKDGLLMQVDTPQNHYDHPRNVFVARFIGSPAMNLLKLPIEGSAQIGPGVIPLQREVMAAAKGAKSLTIGFRPEDLEITSGVAGWPVEVDVIEILGADAYAYGHVGSVSRAYAFGSGAPLGEFLDRPATARA